MADTPARTVTAPTGKHHRLVVTLGPECTELPGPHFEFDRTFILPVGMSALGGIAALMRSKPKKRAGVFGHTDTAGDEVYNKKLSEEHAHVVHAALTHDPGPWEKRYQIEHWGTRAIQDMLNAVKPVDDPNPDLAEDGVDGPLTRAAVKRFQEREGLAADGVAGPVTRKALILAYMKEYIEDPVDAGQFLEIGGAHWMGCGEYNPFAEGRADPESRRVVVLLFGEKTLPSGLPCKIGDVKPCKANLLGKDEPPPETKTPHFRCKVYLGLSVRCPCGPGVELMAFDVQLHDELYQPCTDTEYRLKLGAGGVVHGRTDAAGWLRNAVPRGPQVVTVSYTPPESEEEISLDVCLTDQAADSDDALLCHIFNMGFGGDEDRPMILRFQGARGLPRTGELYDSLGAPS